MKYTDETYQAPIVCAINGCANEVPWLEVKMITIGYCQNILVCPSCQDYYYEHRDE